ncbi:MAG: NADH:quinone oxidoreductase [Oceanicaulis sp.]|uniref:cation:proton antiporter subunit C n=1 Tax=Oceanicaulis TaxID=153232 RepID=UPI0003B4BD49|nr:MULTISPECIES: cation:proton antiporter subunit C [Oceanicaulis]MAP48162.1 NADH:quinone oxidoreductase [Oceanicaulis sp.]HCR65805.1 NADH:quinone oxidoreductase [Oceanicaulis sp.]|tara:strand:+ start:376 stop:780 length:405 start_codon:yes stop_codon:yes gene_type:complete
MFEMVTERFNYAVIIVLMMVGLYAVIATGNLVKRLVGLSIFQTSVFLLYISISKVFGGAPPIFDYKDMAYDRLDPNAVYSNPLPHVLILTAIVVGVATLSVGLALVVRIREAYGSIEDDTIAEADYSLELEKGV